MLTSLCVPSGVLRLPNAEMLWDKSMCKSANQRSKYKKRVLVDCAAKAEWEAAEDREWRDV